MKKQNRITSMSMLLSGLTILGACDNGEPVDPVTPKLTEQSGQQVPAINKLAGVQHNDTDVDTLTEEWQDFVDELVNYSFQERDDMLLAIDQELRKLDVRVNELEIRLRDESSELTMATQESIKEKITTIKQQRQELSQWSEKFQGSTADAWDKLKLGFSDAYTELTEAFQQVESEFEQPPETNSS